jgi:ABC-type antimicrobial peptide transport system permease subunit
MGIKVLTGRGFTIDDRQTSPPVAMINHAFVRRYLAGRDPLTQQVAFGFPTVDLKTMRSIVGVVNDIRYSSLAEEPVPTIYLVQSQRPYYRQMIVLATSLSNPNVLIATVRAAMKELDPQIAVEFKSVPDIVADSLRYQRLSMMLMSLFAGAALLLAAVGIYGVIAYASAQRAGEVATRIALGATPRRIFWLMMNQGRNLSAYGAIGGLICAYVGGRVLASWLYGIRASDLQILVSAVTIVLIVSFLSILGPALQATRINPARVLRLD